MKRTARIIWTLSGLAIAFVVRTMYVRSALDRELIAAIKRLDGRAVKTCLAKGSDPNATDPATCAPMWWRALAHLAGQPEAAVDGDAALLVVFEYCFELQKQEATYRQTDVRPLSSFEPTEIAVALLDNGANVNVHTSQGASTLAYAQASRYKRCVHLLLEHGAQANGIALDGGSLLNWAINFDDPDTVYELIKHGANVNAKDKTGISPLRSALWQGDRDIVRLLKQAGAH